MQYKLSRPKASLAVQEGSIFPEETLQVQLRRMRATGVTPMATGPTAYDDSINSPYDFKSDIRGDKMSEFEYHRLKSKNDFIRKRSEAYEARRPTPIPDPNLPSE